MRYLITGVVSIFLLTITCPAAVIPVSPKDFSGTRNTAADGGLFATSKWADSDKGFQISWDITQNNGLFHYVYAISNSEGKSLSKSVSQLIQNPNINIADAPQFFSENGNQGLPEQVYAIEFDIPNKGAKNFILAFSSERIPVWGDFYVYNSAFGKDPFFGTEHFNSWIPTPDSQGASTPEPGMWLMIGTLTLIVGIAKKRLLVPQRR